MEIETQISAHQYLSIMMKLFFKKPAFIFFELIGIVLLCCYFFEWNFENISTTPTYYLWFALFFIFVNPLIFYISSKRQISNMPELTEKIIYNFSKDNILMSGKNIDTKILWENIKKIKENSDWFIFIQKNKVLNFIPKSSLGAKYDEFKNLLIKKGFRL